MTMLKKSFLLSLRRHCNIHECPLASRKTTTSRATAKPTENASAGELCKTDAGHFGPTQIAFLFRVSVWKYDGFKVKT